MMPSGPLPPSPRLAAICCIALAMAGCALPDPKTATIVAQPANAPVRTITGFSEALTCMDRQLADRGIRNVALTSTFLPDRTGAVPVGTVNMLIGAIATMSQTSHALLYIDAPMPNQVESFDTTQTLMKFGPGISITSPEFIIAGGISQADTNITGGKQGFDVSHDLVQLGGSQDRRVGSISLDLYMRSMRGQAVLPGITSNNTVVITSEGAAGDAGARIFKAGIRFNVSIDKQETTGQAVRTLVELGTVELIGKLFRLPYWECLQIDRNNKYALEQLQAWYSGMTVPERDAYFAQALDRAGYAAAPSGDRLARFQADQNLVANGKPSFETFAKLAQRPDAPPMPGAVTGTAAPVPAVQPQALTVNVRPSGPLDDSKAVASPGASFRVGDTTQMIARVSRGAHLRCYYRDAAATVVQLYPNRYQPDSYVSANAATIVPPMRRRQEGFEIRFTAAGTEEMACIAADGGFDARIAPILAQPDLQPLAGSLDDVLASVRNSAIGNSAIDRVSFAIGH